MIMIAMQHGMTSTVLSGSITGAAFRLNISASPVREQRSRLTPHRRICVYP